MNEPFAFDAQLREALAAGPRIAPASVVLGAFEIAHRRPQRRPWLRALDRRAWPPPRPSTAHPLVARSLRVVFIVALVAAAIAASVAIGTRLRDETREWRLDGAGTLQVLFNDPIAVALPDGRLLVGGWSSSDGRFIEIFDPRTGQSTALGGSGTSLLTSLQSATSLPDGRVLLISWQHADPVSNGRSFGHVFDPATNTLGSPIAMVEDRMEPGVVALADGQVMVNGWLDGPRIRPDPRLVELFDPATNSFETGRADGARTRGSHPHATRRRPDARQRRFGVRFPARARRNGAGACRRDSGKPDYLDVLDPATGATITIGQVPWGRVASPVALPDGRFRSSGRRRRGAANTGTCRVKHSSVDAARGRGSRSGRAAHTIDRERPARRTRPAGRAMAGLAWRWVRQADPSTPPMDGLRSTTR